MRNRILDSTKHVFWDNRGGCYVARLSAIPTCTAEGATTSEALNNLAKTYDLMKGSYTAQPSRMPPPLRPLAR